MNDSKIKVIANGSANFGVFHIITSIILLHKSYLILISDQDDFGIGTVTLSAPPILEGTSAMSAPFPLFGLKNNLIANVVGKTASQKLKAPVLSLIYIKDENTKHEIILKTTMEAVLQAIDIVLKQENEKN